MLKSLIGLVMFATLATAAPKAGSADTFKKEMPGLQSSVDSVVGASESQVVSPSKASYLDGYGIVVVLQVAFEKPMGPFGSALTPAQIRATDEQREKTLKAKMADFIKERIGKTDSLEDTDSLAVIVHVSNYNPAAVELPMQLIFTAKKNAPAQVTVKEF